MSTNSCSSLPQRIEERVQALEGEGEIRRLLARYMRLGDKPALSIPGLEFEELFTPDVIWEGVGSRYATEFGRHEGRTAVMEFFRSFRARERRFVLNLHFLASEAIDVRDDFATGIWIMFEPVTWNTEESALLAARLQVDFRRLPQGWRIAHFRTSNLFCQPQTTGWGDDPSVRPK